MATTDNRPDVKPVYSDEIITVLRGNYSPKVIRDKLEDFHANDIAQVLEESELPLRKRLYYVCDVAMLAEAFEYMEEDEAARCLEEMNITKAGAVVSEMETDTAAAVLKEISKDRRELIIDALDREARLDIALIASYDDEEIGSRMTANFIVINYSLTIKEAMKELVSQARENDNISTLFVTDDRGAFYGALDLKDLITARSEDVLEELIMTSFPYVYGNELIDDCIERLKDYSEELIPVLDNNNKILGVITSQNLIEVVDDEMGEDYARLAGLIAEEDLKEPLKQSLAKRMPWLLALLALGMIVSSVVGAFEHVIAQLTLIMAFQSLILDMAGNVGTQSLAVTIRVLTDENLTFKQKVGLVFKETRVGICVGVILGVMSFVLVGGYLMLVKDQTVVNAFAISGCIGIALMIAMLISSALGTLIPLFFKHIKVDPAVASGPLITTVNDLVAVVTYYGLAWILLLNVLHLA
ncbi:magnesium transporter [Ruminococcaceae bacterium YRB3002]|nr:magnesium transporter [Ruminococcaceae bacterium YRB3002]